MIRNCVSHTIHLPNEAICRATLFYDARKFAKGVTNVVWVIYTGGAGHALLYRVHFGDMQFLHSMASIDGEPARETACQSETSTKL